MPIRAPSRPRPDCLTPPKGETVVETLPVFSRIRAQSPPARRGHGSRCRNGQRGHEALRWRAGSLLPRTGRAGRRGLGSPTRPDRPPVSGIGAAWGAALPPGSPTAAAMHATLAVASATWREIFSGKQRADARRADKGEPAGHRPRGQRGVDPGGQAGHYADRPGGDARSRGQHGGRQRQRREGRERPPRSRPPPAPAQPCGRSSRWGSSWA